MLLADDWVGGVEAEERMTLRLLVWWLSVTKAVGTWEV